MDGDIAARLPVTARWSRLVEADEPDDAHETDGYRWQSRRDPAEGLHPAPFGMSLSAAGRRRRLSWPRRCPWPGALEAGGGFGGGGTPSVARNGRPGRNHSR